MKTKSAIEQFRAPAFHGGQGELAVAVGGEPLGASQDQLTSDPLTLPARLDQAVRDERDTFLTVTTIAPDSSPCGANPRLALISNGP